MTVLRFSVFELEPEAGELRRQGRRVHLAGQPLKVLSLLVRRAGEVVSREELRRHVWGEDTFVDFDRGLNFCIASIRTALNDDARSPRFVETLPKRGYRFLAEVRVAGVGAVLPAKSTGTGRWASAAVLLLLVTLAPNAPRAHTRATARPASLAAFERAQRQMGEGAIGRRKSVPELREAIRLDPRFAEAYYALADTYLLLALKRELPAASALAEARAAASRAVDLEPIAENRQLSGLVRLYGEWDWAGAERDLSEAVRLEPSWDSGLVSYAKLLSGKGDDAGALATIDRAETVSPSCDLLLLDSAVLRYRARRFDDAMRKLEGAERFGPPRQTTSTDWRREIQALKVRVRIHQGDLRAAHQEALAILVMSGVDDQVRRRFAELPPAEALRRFYTKSADMMLAAGAEAGRVPPTRMATVYASLGEDDRAMSWLERAAAEHDPDVVFDLRDPDFDGLRPDPRFRALENRIRGRAAPRASLLEALSFGWLSPGRARREAQLLSPRIEAGPF